MYMFCRVVVVDRLIQLTILNLEPGIKIILFTRMTCCVLSFSIHFEEAFQVCLQHRSEGAGNHEWAVAATTLLEAAPDD
jgi:hypothetical protein